MTATMTLTAIEGLWGQIESLLDASGGEVTPDVEALLAQFDLAQADKVDGYLIAMRLNTARAEMLRRMADEYASKAATATSRAEWLKRRLEQHMARMGLTEIRGVVHRAKYVANGTAPLVGPGIEDPRLLPHCFQKRTIEADKAAIRQSLGSDERLAGLVREGEPGRHVRVY